MQRFEDLPHSVQIRRLRRLAQTALTAYDLEEVRLTPLQHFLNTTFRVDVLSRIHGTNQDALVKPQKERYILRISRPGFQDASTIRSELIWLQAIRRETDLIVPEPVPTRDGSLLTMAAMPSVPESRNCVLFRWIEGRFHHSSLSSIELERVGKFMAKLHLYVEHFAVPGGFIRKRWDLEGLRGAVLGIDPEKGRKHFSLEERKVLDATAERVQETMQALGEGPEVFGLIHADLHQGNYLFHQGRVRAIDFDTSGWGYFLYDIAVTFSTLLNHANFPALRAAFLKGYRRVRPLPIEHERYIETFTAARIMGHTLWLAAHIGEPAFGIAAPGRVAYQVGVLRDFLSR